MRETQYYIPEPGPFAGRMILRAADAQKLERDHAVQADLAASCASRWFSMAPGEIDMARETLLDLLEAGGAMPPSDARSVRTERLVQQLALLFQSGRLLVVPPGLRAVAIAAEGLVHAVAKISGGEMVHDDAVAQQPPGAVNLTAKEQQYVDAAREFLRRSLNLTDDQAKQLEFAIGKNEGGSLNLIVTKVPKVTIHRKPGPRSAIQKEVGKNDNFYEDLSDAGGKAYANAPKIRPPGLGRTAHVILWEDAVPGSNDLVVVGGDNLRIHFDIGNPTDVVGIMKHMFGDLLFGNIAAKRNPDKPIK